MSKPAAVVALIARPATGGMRSHLELLAPRLSDHGFSSQLIAPADFGWTHGASTPHISVPIASASHPMADLKTARHAALAARGADLLHGHGLRGGWIACLAARCLAVPFIVTAHNLGPAISGALSRIALRWMLRRANAVICVSKAVKADIRRLGARDVSANVVPNGIDLASWLFVPESAEPRAPPLIVACGRLAHEKGFDVAIRALAALRAQGSSARMIIAGDGPNCDSLRDLAAALHLGDAVTLPGRTDDVGGLFQDATLVVVPSLSEGQGLVAIEAMACGRAVIASRVGGLVETVVEGETGLLVEPNDATQLAYAIAGLLEDAPARARMGAAGRTRVERLYSVDRMVEQTALIYRQALSAGG